MSVNSCKKHKNVKAAGQIKNSLVMTVLLSLIELISKQECINQAFLFCTSVLHDSRYSTRHSALALMTDKQNPPKKQTRSNTNAETHEDLGEHSTSGFLPGSVRFNNPSGVLIGEDRSAVLAAY